MKQFDKRCSIIGNQATRQTFGAVLNKKARQGKRRSLAHFPNESTSPSTSVPPSTSPSTLPPSLISISISLFPDFYPPPTTTCNPPAFFRLILHRLSAICNLSSPPTSLLLHHIQHGGRYLSAISISRSPSRDSDYGLRRALRKHHPHSQRRV